MLPTDHPSQSQSQSQSQSPQTFPRPVSSPTPRTKPNNTITFSQQSSIAKHFATERSKAFHTSAAHYKSKLSTALSSKIEPTFQQLYPTGKFQTTWLHGRKLDRFDIYAKGARLEAEIAARIKKKEDLKFKRSSSYNGVNDDRRPVVAKPDFKKHFPKGPDRSELDRNVARDQSGLWSLNKPTEIPSRVEKVIARKWGIDADIVYDTKKVKNERGRLIDFKFEKMGFRTTFFNGKREDDRDMIQRDKRLEAELKAELLKEEIEERKQYRTGKLPSESLQDIKDEGYRKLGSGYKLNFSKLQKDQQICNGEILTRLDFIPHHELHVTKWVCPDPCDFEATPFRPGVGKVERGIAVKRERKIKEFNERKVYEEERLMEEEENRAFYEDDDEVEVVEESIVEQRRPSLKLPSRSRSAEPVSRSGSKVIFSGELLDKVGSRRDSGESGVGGDAMSIGFEQKSEAEISTTSSYTVQTISMGGGE